MAISILDAQGRSKLVAALANIKREELDIDHSLSPPMSANTSFNALYSNLSAPPPLPFDITTQLIANRQAAAAYMAVHMPFTSLFPTQSAQSIFNQWAAAQAAQTQAVPQQLIQTAEPHSPPASPISPVTSYLPQTHLAPLPPLSTTTTTNITSNALKHPHSSSGSPTTSMQLGDTVAKKARKLSIKKDLIHSSPVDIPLNVSDLYQSAHAHNGPISPPSSGSGSSPNLSQENLHIPLTVNTHTTHKESSRDKSFTCKICSRSFGYKHVLQNHERTHTGEKPFECPECHKRFTRDHHLKTHMRLHTGEKPYHCSHCDRQFVQVANLRRHLRVHTGERPYKCEVCEHNFSDSNQLKSHILTHNGEKPFECESCHAKFRRRHLWSNHRCVLRSTTPPTPTLSPTRSHEYLMVEPKINNITPMTSSYSSEESMDLGRPINEIRTSSMQSLSEPSEAHVTVEAPLDLSEDFARRARDLQDIFRMPQQVMLQPEQTEPEDLSINSQRSANTSANSAIHMQDDELETEAEEEEELNFPQQQRISILPTRTPTPTPFHADHPPSPYHAHTQVMARLGLVDMQVE